MSGGREVGGWKGKIIKEDSGNRNKASSSSLLGWVSAAVWPVVQPPWLQLTAVQGESLLCLPAYPTSSLHMQN